MTGRESRKIKQRKQRKQNNYKILIINLLLFVLITATGFVKYKNHNSGPIPEPKMSMDGYSREVVNGDVLKLEKPGILIYIKPLSRFYGAEHNPMICWTGSGYSFSRIDRQTINGTEIYTGILKKGADIIYSAWWFDNGSYQTISQAGWRIRALKGENFYLLNINSENEAVLMHEVSKVLK